uniref:Uncharacterized protein n=1 Tax=Glossina pallidipes TaxID=7398 RepID=A0A1B0ABI4_GLOPL
MTCDILQLCQFAHYINNNLVSGHESWTATYFYNSSVKGSYKIINNGFMFVHFAVIEIALAFPNKSLRHYITCFFCLYCLQYSIVKGMNSTRILLQHRCHWIDRRDLGRFISRGVKVFPPAFTTLKTFHDGVESTHHHHVEHVKHVAYKTHMHLHGVRSENI